MLFQDSPKFICFQCSFLAKDLKELTTHVQTSSKQHIDVMLRCECCSKVFRSFWKMELHCYTLEHVLNFCDKYAGCAKPAVPYNYSETYCPFCRKDVDSSSHLVKSDHIGKSQCTWARKFYKVQTKKLVKSNEMNPFHGIFFV